MPTIEFFSHLSYEQSFDKGGKWEMHLAVTTTGSAGPFLQREPPTDNALQMSSQFNGSLFSNHSATMQIDTGGVSLGPTIKNCLYLVRGGSGRCTLRVQQGHSFGVSRPLTTPLGKINGSIVLFRLSRLLPKYSTSTKLCKGGEWEMHLAVTTTGSAGLFLRL
jgi:hypothetical protein